MAFRPNIDDTLAIDGAAYQITAHPAAPGIPYGQAGRRATVYQVRTPQDRLHALKVFTPAFRSVRAADTAGVLRGFAALPGLQVCNRRVLTPPTHGELLAQYPDLRYAVLMRWADGETWQELLLGGAPLEANQSLVLGQRLAQILAVMEQQEVAHCDLSGPNLILSMPTLDIMLVDVEDLFAPTMTPPEKLPGGSPGYAHRTAPAGLWKATADRFAGAILIGEILGWCDPRARQLVYGEQYFDPDTLQQASDRYQTMLDILQQRWGDEIARLFAAAWCSETLEECPSFAAWSQQLGLPAMTQSNVASANPHITRRLGEAEIARATAQPDDSERIGRGHLEAGNVLLGAGNVDAAVNELKQAHGYVPSLAGPTLARALMTRGSVHERAGDRSAALADYRAAYAVAPSGGLRDELQLIIAELSEKQNGSVIDESMTSPRSSDESQHAMSRRWLMSLAIVIFLACAAVIGIFRQSFTSVEAMNPTAGLVVSATTSGGVSTAAPTTQRRDAAPQALASVTTIPPTSLPTDTIIPPTNTALPATATLPQPTRTTRPSPVPTARPQPTSPPTPAGLRVPGYLVGKDVNAVIAILTSIGVARPQIVIDPQSRSKLGPVFDEFPANAVVSTSPSSESLLALGQTIVLGIRAEWDDLAPTPEPTNTPKPKHHPDRPYPAP
jgi:tetratricopeptide (TPR) repeat protein